MHFSNLLCHVSMHSWKDSSGIAWSSLVTAVLMASESWKRVSLMTSLSLGNKKKSHGGQIWRVGWLLQYSNVIFGMKLPNSQGIKSLCIVMMKQPWPRFPQFSSFLPHWAHQTSQDVFIDVLINSLALWQEFCGYNSMDIKKSDQHHLGFGLKHPRLFWVLVTMRSLIQGSAVWWVDRTRTSMTHCLFGELGSVSSSSKMSGPLAHATPFVLHSATWVPFLNRSSSSPDLP